MKADRKRLKIEKADLVSQMQQLYATLESREDQLREFIRNYDQHRKVTAVCPLIDQFCKTYFSLLVNKNCGAIVSRLHNLAPERYFQTDWEYAGKIVGI